MILKEFSPTRANKLSKTIIPLMKNPLDAIILWLQYEDFSSLSKQFQNRIHKHAFYELHFILEGSAIITVGEQNEITIQSNEAIIIDSGVPHFFKYKNDGLKRLSIAFTFSGDSILPDIISGFSVITLSESIIEKLNTVFLNVSENTDLSLYVITNRLCEILYEIVNFEENGAFPVLRKLNHTNLYIEKSKKYINDNLNLLLTCKSVADYCYVNEIYLNRLFKKYTGETLLKYIHRKKIDYSIELLKNKNLSVGAISAMVGFPDEHYFNAFFKKAVGMPPGVYRNINL